MITRTLLAGLAGPSALCKNRLVGRVDGGEPAVGGGAEVGWHAARGEPVGVMLAHERAVACLELRIRDVGAHVEHRVGARRIGNEAGADREELAPAQAEAVGNRLQELVLGRVQDAVGRRDVEQALQHRRPELAARPSRAGRSCWRRYS